MLTPPRLRALLRKHNMTQAAAAGVAQITPDKMSKVMHGVRELHGQESERLEIRFGLRAVDGVHKEVKALEEHNNHLHSRNGELRARVARLEKKILRMQGRIHKLEAKTRR